MSSFRPTALLEGFVNKIDSDNIFLATAFEGCSVEEVNDLEVSLECSLPKAIKEFLRYCGKKWRGLYAIHSMKRVLNSKESYQLVKESIIESEADSLEQINVNDIIIVDFEEHLGDYYWSFYYRSDTKDNPSIFSANSDAGFENYNRPFTEFIGRKLQLANECAVNLSASILREIKDAKSYVNANAVKKLHLTSHELSIMASQLILEFPNLEEVTIPCWNSSYDTSRRWVFDVPYLSTISRISTSRNELIELKLPKEGLPNLKSLAIDSENLQRFPNDIVKCKKLELLSIKKVSMSAFPREILDLKDLERLFLSEVTFREIPNEISLLTKLVHVSFSGNLEKFPEGLYPIKTLETINLSHNNISFIDERILKLKKLTRLYISYNCFPEAELNKLKVLLPNVEIMHYHQKI